MRVGRSLWTFAAAGLVAAGFGASAAAQDTAMRLQFGDPASDFTLEEFASRGEPVSLSRFLAWDGPGRVDRAL
jgi:hypothetical protein